MDLETVILDKQDHIAVVTMNRPQARNAYDDRMQGELDWVWKQLRGDSDVWAIVLTGAGTDAFCAGRDVKELSVHQGEGSLVPRYDPAHPSYGQFGAHIHKYGLPQPLIGAINGYAIGGGLGMVLTCDLRVMSETAWLGDLHVNIGQVGGASRLARGLPYAIASELVLLAGRLSAQRLYEIGAVNMVVPPEQVLPEAMKLAERVCQNSPLAVKRSKEIMLAIFQNDAGLNGLEVFYMADQRLTEDGREGPRAFREKRKPAWVNR